MPALITAENLSKSFSAEPLFQDIKFTVHEGDVLGLIGPNGAGKSTLMRILAGIIDADSGEVIKRRGLHSVYTAQKDDFFDEQTAKDILVASAEAAGLDEYMAAADAERLLAEVQLEPQKKVGELSGGWRKRVQLLAGFIAKPECWFLDEPTNHLDLEAVLWLQKRLKAEKCSIILVSHDRYFLEELCTRVLEIHVRYPQGNLSFSGGYRAFLEQRETWIQGQEARERSLQNIYQREEAWLRRRPKARTTKSVSRIQRADELKKELDGLKHRNRVSGIGDVGFQSSGRRSKDLMSCTEVCKSFNGKMLFRDVELQVSAGARIALLGRNGSGKSTLLHVLCGELTADSGTVKTAHELRLVRFSQDRSQLNLQETLRQALSPNGDTVEYRGSKMHIHAWAQLFQFDKMQLDQRLESLSGGEQARVLLSQLMQQEADVLLLDEPTNDLDIPALEVLETCLIDFPGAMLIVSHDRYLLEEVATDYLAFTDDGQLQRVGSYRQWEEVQARVQQKLEKVEVISDISLSRGESVQSNTNVLSYAEQKEFRGIEKKIANAEAKLEEIQAQMLEPDVISNGEKLIALQSEVDIAQEKVDKLYRRWEELEEKMT